MSININRINKKVERGACRQYIQLFASLRWSPPQRAAKCDHRELLTCTLPPALLLKGWFFNFPQLPMVHFKWLGVTCGSFLPRETLSTSFLLQAVAVFLCECVYVCVGLSLRESRIHHKNKRSAGISTLRLRNDKNPAVTSPYPWESHRKTHTYS